jgi:hypothetical protein
VIAWISHNGPRSDSNLLTNSGRSMILDTSSNNERLPTVALTEL